jgi:hypothetical protein
MRIVRRWHRQRRIDFHLRWRGLFCLQFRHDDGRHFADRKMRDALGFIDPTDTLHLRDRFRVQLFASGDALRGAFRLDLVHLRTIQREQADREERDAEESADTADENHETIDRARRVGRHISWKV